MTFTTLAIKMRYVTKKKKMLSYKNVIKYGLFSFVFVIKLGRSMTEIFSVGLQKTDKGLKA